jgi:hypothetical protein
MVEILVVVLFLLWLSGNLVIPGIVIPNFLLFSLNGHPITVWNLITFAIMVWLLGLLPTPFREVAGVILVLWVLSILGILAFAGLPNLLVIVLIIWLVASILKRH